MEVPGAPWFGVLWRPIDGQAHRRANPAKHYEFIRLGAISITKPYKSIGFGAMDVTKAYELQGFAKFARR